MQTELLLHPLIKLQDYFSPLCDSVTNSDFYLLANDFPSYIETQVSPLCCYQDSRRMC